jgi:hypothetical protein
LLTARVGKTNALWLLRSGAPRGVLKFIRAEAIVHSLNKRRNKFGKKRRQNTVACYKGTHCSGNLKAIKVLSDIVTTLENVNYLVYRPPISRLVSIFVERLFAL